ncbi:MAG: cation transporter [Ferruginibacter sp.]
MKTLSFSIVLLFGVLFSNFSFAQTKKETIKVQGNCGMCKKKIETAAKSAGATAASWNEETKELKVSYAASKTSSTKIQQAVANAGYDTQDIKAEDAVYNKLHGCCQYDRKDAASDIKSCCTTDGCAGHDKCKDENCCKDKSCCKM